MCFQLLEFFNGSFLQERKIAKYCNAILYYVDFRHFLSFKQNRLHVNANVEDLFLQTNSVAAEEQSDLGPHCLLRGHFKWSPRQDGR